MRLSVSMLGVCAHINEDARQSSLLHLPFILFLETGFLTKSRAQRFGYLWAGQLSLYPRASYRSTSLLRFYMDTGNLNLGLHAYAILY